MQDYIEERIRHHLLMLSEAVSFTKKILASCKKGDYEKVAEYSENREKLVNIVDQLQGKIESTLETLDEKDINNSLIQMLKVWHGEITESIQTIDSLDKDIVRYLTNEKNKTSKEIADLFKNKEMFKGYNLKNVSR